MDNYSLAVRAIIKNQRGEKITEEEKRAIESLPSLDREIIEFWLSWGVR